VTTTADTDETDRAGIALCALQVTRQLGLVFREQDTSDFGVDAQAEMKREGRPTGRLVGLQIKTGPSYFAEPCEDGWIFRPKKKHVQYWLNHSLPVYVLLVNLDLMTVYWQEITEQQLRTGPRGGVYIQIPRANVLATARGPWEAAAEKFASTAAEDYEDNLGRLAPSTAAILRSLAVARAGEAALLCAHLARGRHAPELTARTLLVSTPPWLADLEADGYAALADFTGSHAAGALTAEVLLAGADRFPSRKLRFTVNAGLLLLNSDCDRARELLESTRAMSSGFNARAEIGFLILGRPVGSAAPVQIPAEAASRLAAIDDDAVVIDFLARQRAQANDLDAAVSLAEKALALEPDEWQLLDHLAHVLTRRSMSVYRRPDDQNHATELAERAVDQLHQWDGPTGQALGTLLRVLMLAGSASKVLDRALPPPNGRASSPEAARPEVISAAAEAARALGRAELAATLIDSMPEGIDKQLAMLHRDTPSGNLKSDRARWTALLDILDETRPEQLVQAVMRLAELGMDRSQRLNTLVETSMIAPGVQALARATAEAVRDLPSGLPALRVLSDTDDMAAAKMTSLLAAAGQLDDAQAAAQAAYSRFGDPGFLVEAAAHLLQLERPGEASAAAVDALGHSGLDAFSRRAAHHILARIAVKDAESTADTQASTRSWRRAESHFTECTSAENGRRANPRDVWNLIHVQLNLGDHARAAATMSSHNPEISSKYEAELWARVFDTQTGDPALFAQALDLADRFDDDPQFSGTLLSAVIVKTRDEGQEPATPADIRPELASDLRARAFAALGAHAERHGDASPFKIIQAQGGPEELLAKMTEIVRQDHAPLLDLIEMIRQGRAPLGVLSTMLGHPYSSTLAQRGLGYFIAAAGSDADDAADESAAAAARNCDVVADISALLVSSVLGEFEYGRGQFRTLLSPTASRHDISAGRSRMDGWSASSGFVSYDPVRGTAMPRGPDINGHLAALERFAKLELALPRTQLTSAPPVSSLGEPAIEGAEAWLAPVALAKERGLCLWSDDATQRNLARACGVSAFGTVTLQQLRAAERLSTEDADDAACTAAMAARRSEVMTALGERVVDLPVDPETLVEQARREGWSDPGLAAATVGRAVWWTLTPTPWRDLQALLAAARADSGPAAAWQETALWGVSALALDDPARTATLIACGCLIETSLPVRVDHAFDMLRGGSAVAAQRKAPPPADYLAQAAIGLAVAGVLADPQAFVTQIRARLNQEHDEVAGSTQT
jgi:tetratricopeptide (TPR) repeat protein